MSTLDKLKRIDDLGTSAFEVCMALVAATVALTFAVDVRVAQLVAAGVGGVTVFMGMIAVPDTVIGLGQPDLSEDSLRRYLKERQRQTQLCLLWLLVIAIAGACAALGFVVAEVTDDPVGGIVTGACGFLGGVAAGVAKPKVLWPRELRRK